MANKTERISHFRVSLAGLSRGEQKAIFSGLPSAFQAALWRDRLTQAINENSDEQQRDFLASIFDQIHPESYSDAGTKKKLQKFLIEAEVTAKKLFEDFDQYNNLMTTLGDDPCDAPVVKQAGLVDCNCSTEFSGGTSGSGNDCVALGRCQSGNCTTSSFGCGSAWLWSCDGLCI